MPARERTIAGGLGPSGVWGVRYQFAEGHLLLDGDYRLQASQARTCILRPPMFTSLIRPRWPRWSRSARVYLSLSALRGAAVHSAAGATRLAAGIVFAREFALLFGCDSSNNARRHLQVRPEFWTVRPSTNHLVLGHDVSSTLLATARSRADCDQGIAPACARASG